MINDNRNIVKSPAVIIFTEAGKNYGYGHLTRCLALAQGFKKRGVESTFYIRGNHDVGKFLSGFIWYSKDWLINQIDTQGHIVIIDSYYADEFFCNKIYQTANKVIFFDDYNRINYPGGLVLNSVLNADRLLYSENQSITYLLGSKYHPFRQEFWEAKQKEIKSKVEKILITFGGSDMTNETPQILKMLTLKYPDIKKHVIIGSGFSNIHEIETESDKNTILIYSPNAEQMKTEMQDCDLAISAAGQTTYELARIGTPSLIKKIAENQDCVINSWVEQECFQRFFDINDLEEGIENYSFELRMLHSVNAIKMVDGKGIDRVFEKVLNDSTSNYR